MPCYRYGSVTPSRPIYPRRFNTAFLSTLVCPQASNTNRPTVPRVRGSQGTPGHTTAVFPECLRYEEAQFPVPHAPDLTPLDVSVWELLKQYFIRFIPTQFTETTGRRHSCSTHRYSSPFWCRVPPPRNYLIHFDLNRI
jgi:hypothetical protein